MAMPAQQLQRAACSHAAASASVARGAKAAGCQPLGGQYLRRGLHPHPAIQMVQVVVQQRASRVVGCKLVTR